MPKESQTGQSRDCKPDGAGRQECMYSFGKIETELDAQKKSTEQLTILFDAKLAAISVKLEAIETSIEVASEGMDHRLASMNEFRETLRDQASLFTTRAEVKKEFDIVEVDLRSLRESRAILEGKASQKFASASMGIAIISLMIALMNAAINVILKLTHP